MFNELLPVIISIAVLGIIYLVLKMTNTRRKNRLNNKRFHRNTR